MKITGDDEIGKAQLDNFINPKNRTRLSRPLQS